MAIFSLHPTFFWKVLVLVLYNNQFAFTCEQF